MGLSEVSLANSSKSTKKAGGRAILKASPCQWIDLEKVREEGSGCVDGSKFVVSKERGVSKYGVKDREVLRKGERMPPPPPLPRHFFFSQKRSPIWHHGQYWI